MTRPKYKDVKGFRMHDVANLAGETFRRGDLGYEAARRASCRNARLPGRYPDMIFQARR